MALMEAFGETFDPHRIVPWRQMLRWPMYNDTTPRKCRVGNMAAEYDIRGDVGPTSYFLYFVDVSGDLVRLLCVR